MSETPAFDLYGTLVDPLGIAQQLERALGSAAGLTAELWRMKQLEYTFRLTAMQRYDDFEQVTAKALDYDIAQETRLAVTAHRDSLAPAAPARLTTISCWLPSGSL
jgi:2-haloacid dehalogenase